MGYNHYRYARKIASGIEIAPVINTDPMIEIEAGASGDINLVTQTNRYIDLFQAATNYLRFHYQSSIATITTGQTNGDLLIAPNGTGVLRYGTKTGTGDVACDGYISIKDSSGNAVKLMTTA